MLIITNPFIEKHNGKIVLIFGVVSLETLLLQPLFNRMHICVNLNIWMT